MTNKSIKLSCKECGNTDLIYGGTVKGSWYCFKHCRDAENKALHEDFPQFYDEKGRGITKSKEHAFIHCVVCGKAENLSLSPWGTFPHCQSCCQANNDESGLSCIPLETILHSLGMVQVQ